jgi:hypothetical protein
MRMDANGLNDEARMTNDERSSNAQMPKKPAHFVGHSDLVVSFVIRHSTFVILQLASIGVIRGLNFQLFEMD